MSQVFHEIEKKIIKVLQPDHVFTIDQIKKKTGLESDQVRRGIEWLKLKNLARIEEIPKDVWNFTTKGDEAIKNGLPERRLVNEIKKGNTSFDKLKSVLGSDFNAAIAIISSSAIFSSIVTKNFIAHSLCLHISLTSGIC